jgi:hypothetical protein
MYQGLHYIAGFLQQEMLPFGIASLLERFFPHFHEEICSKCHFKVVNNSNMSILICINELSKQEELGDRAKKVWVVFEQLLKHIA